MSASTALVAEGALRERLQHFFQQADALPLAVLRLLRFNFGWSVFASPAITAASIDASLHGAAVNGVQLEEGGLEELAALLGGEDASLLAHSCAAPMSRPMVREEAFRSTFAWLQQDKDRTQTQQFSAAHYTALEQLILSALTDTWSAVRKASARALGRAIGPLSPAHLRELHSSILSLRLGLPAHAPSSATSERRPSLGELGGASSSASAWKAHEGLLLGTASLLRYLAAVGRAAAEGSSPERPGAWALHELFVDVCKQVWRPPPHRTAPRRAAPYRTTPRRAAPRRALPHRAALRRAAPHRAQAMRPLPGEGCTPAVARHHSG